MWVAEAVEVTKQEGREAWMLGWVDSSSAEEQQAEKSVVCNQKVKAMTHQNNWKPTLFTEKYKDDLQIVRKEQA